MSVKIKIAVDAMGGDGSPKKVIDGIIYNHQTNKNNFYKIFGDKNKISPLIENKINKEFYEIFHTENAIYRIFCMKNFIEFFINFILY